MSNDLNAGAEAVARFSLIYKKNGIPYITNRFKEGILVDYALACMAHHDDEWMESAQGLGLTRRHCSEILMYAAKSVCPAGGAASPAPDQDLVQQGSSNPTDQGSMLRGGSWLFYSLPSRSAHRIRRRPAHAFIDVGFRVACASAPASSAGQRVWSAVRGGSWCTFPRFCRSAYRAPALPDYADDLVGFRVVCLPKQSSEALIVNSPWKLLRGGSWFNYSHDCRAAIRGSIHPAVVNARIGVRPCCPPPKQNSETLVVNSPWKLLRGGSRFFVPLLCRAANRNGSRPARVYADIGVRPCCPVPQGLSKSPQGPHGSPQWLSKSPQAGPAHIPSGHQRKPVAELEHAWSDPTPGVNQRLERIEAILQRISDFAFNGRTYKDS